MLLLRVCAGSAGLLVVVACSLEPAPSSSTNSPGASASDQTNAPAGDGNNATGNASYCAKVGDGSCAACQAFYCPCADGTQVPVCACSGKTCAQSTTYCPSATECASHGGPSTTNHGGSSTAPASPGACVSFGDSGCNSFNNPSGCCTSAGRSKIICEANNDGAGNAQCCVKLGDPCLEPSDCCGYAGASLSLQAHYACTNNVCALN